MARPFEFDSPEECLHHHIGMYYKECAEIPGIKFKPEEHILLADTVNERYLKDLLRYPEFDYEKFAPAFKDCIDFLTKIYTKKKERDADKESKQAFLNSINRTA